MTGTPDSILKYPDPLLLVPAGQVKLAQAKVIVKKLRAAAANPSWGLLVGLAAPQIGISKRVFLALDEAFINPEIVWHPRTATRTALEGCYSLEDNKFDYLVRRYTSVKLKWLDEAGQQHIERFLGMKAQVIQHECEHLQGILCNGAGHKSKGH